MSAARPDDSLYRELCTNVGFALIATDTEFRIRIWNPAAARLFNASSEDMIGKPLLDVVPAAYQSLALRLFHRTLLHAETSEFEIPYENARGEQLFLAVTISPLFDDAAARVGMCAGVRDITRRVALQKEIAANQTLAALGNLCSGVAHHFNNLLGGIGTSVDFAMNTSDRAATRRALRLTAESVARAARITRSLLTFASGEPQDGEVADLDRIVRQCVDEQRGLFEEHGIRVHVDAKPIPPAPVPLRHVRTAIQNLLDNAFEAMPNGGDLWVRLHLTDADIRLFVEDTGVGIPPDQLERVCQPFFTTKGALAGGSGGHVGLGLAVVHGVVRELGGTLWLESEPGHGTRAVISLPLSLLR